MRSHALRVLTALGAAAFLYACGSSSGSGTNDASATGDDGSPVDGSSPADSSTADGGGTTSDATSVVDASDASKATDATMDSGALSDTGIDSSTSVDAGADSASHDAASDATRSDGATSDAATSDASDSGGSGNGCNNVVNGAPVVTLTTVNAAAPVGTGGVFYPGTYYLTSATAYLPDGGTAPSETLKVSVGLFTSGGGGSNWQYAYDWARSVDGAPDGFEDFWFNASGSTFYLQETCPISAYPEGGSFTYDNAAMVIHLYFVPAGASYTVEEVYTHQ